jgi:hypothetical protein
LKNPDNRQLRDHSKDNLHSVPLVDPPILDNQQRAIKPALNSFDASMIDS